MTQEKGEKIRFIYGISLAVFSVLVGVLFIMQTWRIYLSAEQSPYSPEMISKMFGQIAIPVFLWIAAAIGGGVLACLFPEEKQRPKAYVDVRTALKRTEKRLPTSSEYISKIHAVKSKEEEIRKWLVIDCTVLFCGVIFLCFAVLFDLFYLPIIERAFFVAHDHLVDRLFQMATLLMVVFTLVGFCGIWLDNSRKRQQKRYVEILSSAKGKPKAEGTVLEKSKWAKFVEKINFLEKISKENKEKTVFGVRIALGVIGATFVVWGIANGGMKDVLLKAINICTQCIGLG